MTLLLLEKTKKGLQNEAERYALTIVPEARGQAQARIRNAEGYLLEVVANAEGEVGRFTQLLQRSIKRLQRLLGIGCT